MDTLGRCRVSQTWIGAILRSTPYQGCGLGAEKFCLQVLHKGLMQVKGKISEGPEGGVP
jgi:hypothetical protein